MATRRRANGEGAIYWNEARQRHEGLLDLGRGPDGRRRRRKVTGRDRAEVARRLSELRQQLATGQPVGGGSLTVGELLERWVTEVAPGRVEPSTVASYRWAVGHLVEGLGAHRLVRLTPEDVEAFLAVKADALGRASLVRLRAVLGQAIRWAEKRGHVARNVAALADLPVGARPTTAGRATTVDEAHRLLEVIAGHRHEALWLLQLTAGLRPGEAAGLRWPDVDLVDGLVHVRSSLRWTDGRPHLAEPKTPRSRRSLVLAPAAVAALRAHRTRQSTERLAAGPRWSTEWPDLVFTAELGTPLDPANLRRALARVTQRAGLDGLRPYDLRHSAASLLAAAGVPLERVADVLGHDGLRMARLVYVHALSPSIDAAAGPMQALLDGRPPTTPDPSSDADLAAER
jgi:integrase